MKKQKEFNLSEKMMGCTCGECVCLKGKDVKEFIKSVLDDIEGGYEGVELIERIKKRAGDKLK